jgi:hypothetical protein
LLTLYSAFASPAESAAFRSALLDGLGWGEAKQRLFERIERDLAALRRDGFAGADAMTSLGDACTVQEVQAALAAMAAAEAEKARAGA